MASTEVCFVSRWMSIRPRSGVRAFWVNQHISSYTFLASSWCWVTTITCSGGSMSLTQRRSESLSPLGFGLITQLANISVVCRWEHVKNDINQLNSVLLLVTHNHCINLLHFCSEVKQFVLQIPCCGHIRETSRLIPGPIMSKVSMFQCVGCQSNESAVVRPLETSQSSYQRLHLFIFLFLTP